MAVVLGFGDSLTFGYGLATGGSYAPADRWQEAICEVLPIPVDDVPLAREVRLTLGHAVARAVKELLA
jgi:lysophospholipase L1-like esterase